MQKHIKHTAFLLLLVIAYPFLFQSLHIIYHDHNHNFTHRHVVNHGSLSHTPTLSGSCTHDSGNDAHHTSGDHNHNTSGEKPGAGTELWYLSCTLTPQNKDHDHRECPLCDHEFAKFKLERSLNIFSSEEIFNIINTCLYQDAPLFYTGNNVSLRAPPRHS